MALTVSIQSLLDAGVHFGHQTRRWNPKMKPYIIGERSGIYVIDLKQTLYALDEAYSFVSSLASTGQTIMFIGTKKQAQEPIREAAEMCGMPYVNQRWMGGMLTNFQTIRSRVKRMTELENLLGSQMVENYSKKERASLQKELQKLQAALNGIRDMQRLPAAVFIVDTTYDDIAVKEAQRLHIPIVALLDTNSDPDGIDYGIPANDDSIGSIELICALMAQAITEGAAATSLEEMQQDSAETSASAPAEQGNDAASAAQQPPETSADTKADAEPVEEAPTKPAQEAAAEPAEAPAAEEAAADAADAAQTEQAAATDEQTDQASA